jgi:F-type H+-transporting ATPase subunit c
LLAKRQVAKPGVSFWIWICGLVPSSIFDQIGVMNPMNAVKLVGVVIVVLLVGAGPLFAAEGAPPPLTTSVFSGSSIGAGFGAAFVMVGAGYGFGRIGQAALESMARQPEVAGRLQTAMIVIAALLEGATFFALLICMQIRGSATF